jgi:hypothetical protein
MPQVGKMKFGDPDNYTKQDENNAKAYAAKTGQPIKNMKKYMAGGMLNLSSGPGYPKPKQSKCRGGGKATRGTNFRKV